MKSNERLKQIRKELKLSQIELCNILGIKQGAYSQVESGKVGISGSIKLFSFPKKTIQPDKRYGYY